MKAALISVNRKLLKGDARNRVVEAGDRLVFAWGVKQAKGAFQSAYEIELSAEGKTLYSSGKVKTSLQEAYVDAALLPFGKRIDVSVTVTDDLGNVSEKAEAYFYIGNTEWKAKWITHEAENEFATLYFRRDFSVKGKVKSANLYGCGLGYHVFYLNGARVGNELLDPAFTDYTKSVQYAFWPEIQNMLTEGENTVAVKVGGGWRDNYGYVLKKTSRPFLGIRQLSAFLEIEYENGEKEIISTDETWQAGTGASTRTRLFDGEIYNANLDAGEWKKPGYDKFVPAKLCDAPGGVMKPMILPPIREMGTVKPITVSEPAEGKCIYDFGVNLTGVVRLKLKNLEKNQTITVTQAEELDEDGQLYTACLRKAKCTDIYIASGDERDLAVWQPEFTYHGFRYMCIEGYEADEGDVEAVFIHTDLESDSFFRSGSGELNALQAQILQTERDNMHSILTDCPQRDEREGWMNDATVRFDETPYNFDCAGMFRKLVRDLMDEQRPDGAITCTAPYVGGNCPADPVCSSFLVAGMQSYMHFGDKETLEEAYPAYKAWENCLLSNSTGYIVNYSYYGDWAGPVFACETGANCDAKSKVTPGVFMSTGYSFFNCKTIAKMARVLGKEDEAEKYEEVADKIRKAMLDKWFNKETATVATGSLACQAFALWLGILPEESRAAAAKKMRDDLVDAGYAFTTGNLCSRYMADMLTEYGYADETYELLTRSEYPSLGFMRQQEATTVWERFELKKDPGMNSHNHPMYGAVGSHLFEYFAGVKPLEGGFRVFSVKPRMPEKLLSCQAGVSTRYGRINVRWTKRYGAAHLYVDVPFGTECHVEFMGEKKIWTKGTHSISVPVNE